MMSKDENNHTMTKIDPIIAVKDVERSSSWYEEVLGFRRAHGEKGRFAVLLAEDNEICLCLHKWGEHNHPTMTNPDATPANGLILYFRTDKLNEIRQVAERLNCVIEEDIHLSPNSTKNEFSMRDPDGYYLTITEFHTYEG